MCVYVDTASDLYEGLPSLPPLSPAGCLSLGDGGLTFHQRGEERDVGGFPPASREVQAEAIELLSQAPAAILRLRSRREEADGNTSISNPVFYLCQGFLSQCTSEFLTQHICSGLSIHILINI